MEVGKDEAQLSQHRSDPTGPRLPSTLLILIATPAGRD
jgi:hypothetical protein